MGQSRGSLSAAEVADQLEGAIRRYASEGWDFYQLSDVNIEVQPGCISGLFGAKVQYVRFDQLIFRRDVEAGDTLSTSREPRHTAVAVTRNGSDVETELEPPLDMNGMDRSSARKPWLSPFCYHCGADIPAGTEKCPACGLNL
jgi:hypothetical protein